MVTKRPISRLRSIYFLKLFLKKVYSPAVSVYIKRERENNDCSAANKNMHTVCLVVNGFERMVRASSSCPSSVNKQVRRFLSLIHKYWLQRDLEFMSEKFTDVKSPI